MYAVYNGSTSDLATHIDWKKGDEEKVFHANENKEKAGVAILTCDKSDFKIKTVTRDEEGHYIMIKGPIQ